MSTSAFSKLKRNTNALEKLTKAIEDLNKGPDSENRFWKADVDKAGNGYAVIRFLPAPAADGDEALPWVKIFDHGFQGPGGWYIENSLTTLGQNDPVSEYNTVLWNSGVEANKDIARKQKRRLKYISNILVIDDPKHPENNGKVFLFKYGKKIFDKISEAMNPQFEDETPINPFDFWKGANFKLKIRKVEGYQNYDKSEFEKSSVICDMKDEEIEEIWKQEFSLKEFLDPSNFKSYTELKARLVRVLGQDGSATVTETAETASPPWEETEAPAPAPAPAAKKVSVKKESKATEDDSDLAYFSSLADD